MLTLFPLTCTIYAKRYLVTAMLFEVRNILNIVSRTVQNIVFTVATYTQIIVVIGHLASLPKKAILEDTTKKGKVGNVNPRFFSGRRQVLKASDMVSWFFQYSNIQHRGKMGISQLRTPVRYYTYQVLIAGCFLFVALYTVIFLCARRSWKQHRYPPPNSTAARQFAGLSRNAPNMYRHALGLLPDVCPASRGDRIPPCGVEFL